MTTKHEREGVLAAVERIVNRGESGVVGETLTVLRRLYGEVELRDGRLVVSATSDADRALLERIATLISGHSRAES